MNTELLTVAFGKGALYLPDDHTSAELSAPAAGLLAALRKHGYTVDEDCLHHLNALSEADVKEISDYVGKVFLTDANWAALLRDWAVRPSGKSFADSFYTFIVNICPELRGEGTILPCGHFIPDGVFDLRRYTGCPFCGTQFETAPANTGVDTTAELKILSRWSRKDAEAYATELLSMPLPPDATQADHIVRLLKGLPPEFIAGIGNIACVETRVLAAATVGGEEGLRFLKAPGELLRMLWYGKTGELTVDRPKDVKDRYFTGILRKSGMVEAKEATEARFKLHYSRTFCGAVARWFDALPMTEDDICADMHRHRQMWVRFIRALRLNDYARRHRSAKLTGVLDRFYRSDYSVWGGKVEAARQAHDSAGLFSLLSERPGAFARCLYDTILDFGADDTLDAFTAITDRLPVRLLVSLSNGAAAYFLPEADYRYIHLPKGQMVKASLNPGLAALPGRKRVDIASKIQIAVLKCIYNIYSRREALPGDKVYIERTLWDCPVPVGDRGRSVNGIGYAIPGQTFKVAGDKVRLFLHWGIGMEAQHYDMDLSCALIGNHQRTDIAYYSLDTNGASHSGDIQSIPEKKGAAEYIELDLPVLLEQGYEYAVFTANAYSVPKLASDMVVGWMSSRRPMKSDNETGVAYNPADVQHMVSVAGFNASRGMVFGILDIIKHEILWLEMANGSQRLDQLDIKAVKTLRERMESKIKIGELISMRAQSHGQAVETSDSPEAYGPDNWQKADIL